MLTDRYRNILIATVGIIVVICDALRDAWVNRAVEWWQWHTVKWIAFYSPFIIVTLLRVKLTKRNLKWYVAYALLCWLLWQFTYYHLAHL